MTDNGEAVGKADRLTLAALNQASHEEFTDALDAVFEHSPWVAEAAWPAAPFATVADLHRAMVAVARSAPPEQRLALIRAHPDLAGSAARSGALTAASAAEQGSTGLLNLSDAEFSRFHRLNRAYRERFGFPFIVAVRRHSKTSLFATFEARLRHSRETEIEMALEEIFAITALRLERLLGDGG